MTFVHFLNCVALSYAPYVVVYKSSILSEYAALNRIIFAGLVYMGIQLCKMLLLATFFPPIESTSGDFLFMPEFLKTSVDVIDLAGIYFLINRTVGKPELKVMIAGFGWASAEVLLSNLVPFWVGARGLEFDWKYTIMALDSNVSMVHILSMSALVWAYIRTDLNKSLKPVVTTLLMISIYRNFICEFFAAYIVLSPWVLLMLKAGVTVAISTMSLQLYLGLAKQLP